jgi:CBS domain-containing protein
MICPWCENHNLPGADFCSECLIDLTDLDRPIAQDRVERSLMDDTVSMLHPEPPVTVRPETTIDQAMAIMLEHTIGAILVVDAAGQLVGIFSERDLLVKVAGLCIDYPTRPISEFMTRRPETIRGSDSLAFALHIMDCGDYRHLPVVEDGRLLGMISVRDMLRHITAICRACSA